MSESGVGLQGESLQAAHLGHGRVAAVSLSPKHGFSKQTQTAIQLLTGLGIEGDAHCGATVQHLYLKRRDPSAPNRMQVHLLPAELLDEFGGKGFHIGAGDLGENVLTRGLDLIKLPQATRLRIGADAIVELTCLRQPCRQIDAFQGGLQKEMYAASGESPRYRAGVMGIVLRDGEVRPADLIEVELPKPPYRVLTV